MAGFFGGMEEGWYSQTDKEKLVVQLERNKELEEKLKEAVTILYEFANDPEKVLDRHNVSILYHNTLEYINCSYTK